MARASMLRRALDELCTPEHDERMTTLIEERVAYLRGKRRYQRRKRHHQKWARETSAARLAPHVGRRRYEGVRNSREFWCDWGFGSKLWPWPSMGRQRLLDPEWWPSFRAGKKRRGQAWKRGIPCARAPHVDNAREAEPWTAS